MGNVAQVARKACPMSNGSLPSKRNTFTEVLIEYTSTSPTAPGVASTVRNKSASLSTIFTTWRDSQAQTVFEWRPSFPVIPDLLSPA
jgi:hypothetical protein